MRRLLRLALLLLASLATTVAQSPAPATPPLAVPRDLDGRWLGEARHGTETATVGFAFERQTDGRVIAKLWLPELNTYGSAIGWLAYADGKFSVAALVAPFALDHGTLSGQLFFPDLTFTAQRSDTLPAEPMPPAVNTGPAPRWTYRAGAGFWGTPVVADGLALIGDEQGRFHAVRVRDGTAAWTFDAHTPLYGTAAVAGDAVYFAGDDGLLHKLVRATGEEIWHVDLGGGALPRGGPSPTSADWDFGATCPIVDGGVVYTGSADGHLHALDAATGKTIWSFATGGKIRAAALAAGDRVYVGSRDHCVYALDRRTSSLVWKFDTGSPVTTPPVLAAGNIVIGTRDRSLLLALDAATGREKWSDYYWSSWVESAPVLVDGVLYIGSSDSRRVRALDPATGRAHWTTQVWGWTWGTPLVVGDTVYYATGGTPKYFISEHPSVGALDRRTGAPKWRRVLPYLENEYVSGVAGSLALADDGILAAGRDGTLTAYPVE